VFNIWDQDLPTNKYEAVYTAFTIITSTVRRASDNNKIACYTMFDS